MLFASINLVILLEEDELLEWNNDNKKCRDKIKNNIRNSLSSEMMREEIDVKVIDGKGNDLDCWMQRF